MNVYASLEAAPCAKMINSKQKNQVMIVILMKSALNVIIAGAHFNNPLHYVRGRGL